jgi:hypothetical protein
MARRALTLLLASAAAPSAGALVLDDRVPIRMALPGKWERTAEGARAGLSLASVTFARLDWAAYRENPASLPMFGDFLAASGAEMGAGSMTAAWGDLEAEYDARGCDGGAAGCRPSGVVYHHARCGSTLVQNILAALPNSFAYSETGFLHQFLVSRLFADLAPADQVRALRVLVAAMGRPLALPGAAPGFLFTKVQSALALALPTFRAAFPATPWAFVHREGVEVLASQFRDVSRADGPKGSPPCVQNVRLRNDWPALHAFARVGGAAELLALTPANYIGMAPALARGVRAEIKGMGIHL